MPEAVLPWVDVNVLAWLKQRERKILTVTVAAQLLILVGMIALRAIPLVTGQTLLVDGGISTGATKATIR